MLHFSIFIYIKTQGNASNKYVDNTNVVGVWNWRMRILHYFKTLNFMRCLSLGREEKRCSCSCLVERPEGNRNHMEDLDLDGRKIIKSSLKQNVRRIHLAQDSNV